jgi:hypothetical protein
VAVNCVEDLGCLLGVLGEPSRSLFETRLGYMVLPHDRVADHGAAGAIACRFCSALQHSAAKIGERADERGVGCGVRAGLGVPAPGDTGDGTQEQTRLPEWAVHASGQGC